MSSVVHAAVVLLGPLDAARRLTLQTAAYLFGPPRVALWSRGRELRVGVLGALGVTTSFVLAVVAPAWLLALGPIVLGVPHLAADLRYLVARPGLHRQLPFWVGVGVPVALAGVTGRAAWAGVAIAGAAATATAPALRRVAGVLAGAALALAAASAGHLADLLFAHLHNVIAVLVFWTYRRRVGRAHLAPLALFVAGSLALGAGVFDDLALRSLGLGPARLPMEQHLDALAPTWAVGSSFPFALRLVVLFAFAQSVHYGVWLRLVPEEARPRAAPRSFAMSLRALVGDLGAPLVACTAALAAFFLAFAFVDLPASRDLYLRVAGFHGSLEVGALTWALVRSRRLGSLA